VSANARTVLMTGTGLIPDEVVEYVRSRGFTPQYLREDQATESELAESLRGVSGYLIGGEEEVTAAHIEAATDLEVLAFVGTDYRSFVPGWRRACELGVAVASCPGVNANAVAEFMVLLMLTMARPFTEQIVGAQSSAAAPPVPGTELLGRSLGILGAGRIGGRVARIAGAGLGMRVSYHGPRRNEPLEQALGMPWVSWHDLLESSDVLCLTRPSPVDGERPVLAQQELTLMRPGAMIINIGHRDLLDPAALLTSVRETDIRVAVDSRCAGPAWDPLVALGPGRFLTMPQMGYYTTEANLRAAYHAATAVCDVLAGNPSEAVINPDHLAVRRGQNPTRLAPPEPP
jgi:D-3-phosphoglycerate dehydrogenase / 2-oxoglutarate reductase